MGQASRMVFAKAGCEGADAMPYLREKHRSCSYSYKRKTRPSKLLGKITLFCNKGRAHPRKVTFKDIKEIFRPNS